MAKGLKATELLDVCLAAAGGGKGGGRPDLANASLPGSQAQLDLVVTAAKEYLTTKLA